MPRVHIDVMLKDEILDPQGQAVERALPQMGFDGVRSVRIGKHIELELDDAGGVGEGGLGAGDAGGLDAMIEEMATKLLANPVIETFRWRVETTGD